MAAVDMAFAHVALPELFYFDTTYSLEFLDRTA
jgi:hypothetical protein